LGWDWAYWRWKLFVLLWWLFLLEGGGCEGFGSGRRRRWGFSFLNLLFWRRRGQDFLGRRHWNLAGYRNRVICTVDPMLRLGWRRCNWLYRGRWGLEFGRRRHIPFDWLFFFGDCWGRGWFLLDWSLRLALLGFMLWFWLGLVLFFHWLDCDYLILARSLAERTRQLLNKRENF
jgi:hypothetical protein